MHRPTGNRLTGLSVRPTLPTAVIDTTARNVLQGTVGGVSQVASA